MSGPQVLLNLARPRGVQDPLVAAQRAVRAGADGVGFADSPRLFPDPFLSAASLLNSTDVALSGPCVMGLGLHHPSVVAQSCATLADQFPGRVLTVVGRGESSLVNEGLPVPSLRAYRDLVKEFVARLDDLAPQTGPILGAGSGPRTIEVNAAVVGGVLLDVGGSAPVVARAVATARAARPDASCWLFLRGVVTADDVQAREAAAPILGSCATRLVSSPQWYGVADDMVERVTAVAAAHDYRRHGTVEASAAQGSDREAQELIGDLFLLTGSADEIAARLRPLADLGVDGVVLAGGTAGVEDRLAATVSAVRAGLAHSGRR